MTISGVKLEKIGENLIQCRESHTDSLGTERGEDL
jgi:hypothetical protein